jgi:maltose O-acetyltransferase
MKKIFFGCISFFKSAVYYILVYNIPHSRFCPLFNTIRKFYICNVLKVAPYCKKSAFQNKIYLSNFSDISIGRHCRINEYVFIQGARIGDHVMIAPYVTILSSTHRHDRLDIPMIKQEKRKNITPVIGNDVWIGTKAVIMPGVHIADGCIIGAGAVVTRDTEPYTIYGGVPARKIRSRGEASLDHPKIRSLFKVNP